MQDANALHFQLRVMAVESQSEGMKGKGRSRSEPALISSAGREEERKRGGERSSFLASFRLAH